MIYYRSQKAEIRQSSSCNCKTSDIRADFVHTCDWSIYKDKAFLLVNSENKYSRTAETLSKSSQDLFSSEI